MDTDLTLPEGYRMEINGRGRVVYITPAPYTKITNRAMLLDFQEKGKFLGKVVFNLYISN